MGIVKETIKNQMHQQNLQYMQSSTTATIIRYDKRSNKADIIYDNPVGEGEVYRGGIPVSNSLGGLTSGGIKSGQQCTITFVNGNINAPLITGVNTSTYKEKTCVDQGAYIVDESIKEEDSGTVSNPLCADWLDENNIWEEKFQDYSNIDTNKEARKLSNSTERFGDDEVGLTNLQTKSTLKMKQNGDIDIFVSDNVGIRISKERRKIYLYGFDVSINGEIDLLALLKKCRDCEFDGYRDETKKNKLKEDVRKYIGSIEETIEELKKCIAYTKEITGNVEHFSYLDITISKFELLKKNFNEGRYDDNMEDLQDVYDQMISYYEYFKEELIAARERWGLS